VKRLTIAGVALCALSGGQAVACSRCDGYVDPYRPIRVYPLGFHERYGFYDSGYKASPGGGFHSVVGPNWVRRAAKHRGQARRR
jgi:hypothetical protein